MGRKLTIRINKDELKKKLDVKDGLHGFPGLDGKDGVDGKDGKDANVEDLMPLVESKLLELTNLIKEELLEEVKKNKPRVMGRARSQVTRTVDLSDQVNGSTKDFTLPKDVVQVLGLWGTQFPITFSTSDWTLAGNTLTLDDSVSAPQSGQTLVALCEVLFYP